MLYKTLGRTGFTVSRMGLGCGGHSRLGLRDGNSANAERIVREGYDLGINFFDTAESYGTEEALGKALAGIARDKLIISTKVGATWEDEKSSPAQLRKRLEACLNRLQTDYVDVFHLHGVPLRDYKYSVEILVPEMQKLKDEGKIRAIGITESFIPEPDHRMLAPALEADNCWDVVMVGFSMLNQSARHSIFPKTVAKKIGTLGMFAVRRALSQPTVLIDLMKQLVQDGLVDPYDFDHRDPLGFVTGEGIAHSLQEAAYRYCLWEPGMDVVLSGTGNVDHLRHNAKSLIGEPLPHEVTSRLSKLFAHVDSISGN
jgi:L-galactose dehydrogenase